MIKSYSVENFKCFKDQQSINLKPITVLLGCNSSGKTSIIQALLLIKQTLEVVYSYSPLVLNGKYVDLGWFRDISYEHLDDNLIKIGINLPNIASKQILRFKKRQMYLEKEDVLTEIEIEITFKFNKSKKLIQLKHYHLKDTEGKLSLELDLIRTNYNYHLESSLGEVKYVKKGKSKVNFANIFTPMIMDLHRPYRLKMIDEYDDYYSKIISRIFQEIRFVTDNDFSYLRYIGPLRNSPQRYYAFSGATGDYVGFKGENAFNVLYLERLEKKYKRKILDNINKWLVKSGFNSEIIVESISENLYKIKIDDKIMNTESNISDFGFGLSQFLPILIQISRISENETIIVEQPELHLNPRLQAEIADIFIEKARKNSFIIETHSEHLIARIQRRIAEGKLENKDVIIYFFARGKDRVTVDKLEINKYGEIPNWPKGFFEDEYIDRLKQLKAINKRYKNE